MRKPMKLTWFPKREELHEEGPATVYVTGGRRNIPVGYVDHCLGTKNLSAAELAAEWWRQKSWFDTAWRRAENSPGSVGLINSREDQWERLAVMERFATLPHARYADYE